MRIIRKFKQLTSFTYPYGTESDLERYLPQDYQKDEWGNYYLQIGDNPTTMFTCHLDTSCGQKEKVNHVFDGDFIKTDGSTILGADDKAGMTVLLYMISQSVEGLYYFFIGEERGCIGSGNLAKNWQSNPYSNTIKKVVSFDRRGTDSIITEQFWGVCCSDEFANELALRLNLANSEFNFKPDPTGIFTDSAKFTDLVPECTNISVGYYNEHTGDEYQSISFLKKLCMAVCEIDWESLPIVRNQPLDDELDQPEILNTHWETNELYLWPKDFYFVFNIGGEKKRMFISRARVEQEEELIKKWLKNLSPKKFDFYFSEKFDIDVIYWDGKSLYDEFGSENQLSSRNVLMNLIPDLLKIHSSDLRPYPYE
jgi:hypothetical protein